MDDTDTLFLQLQSAVGQHQTFRSERPIGHAAFRLYAGAVGDPNPLYTNPEAAHSAGLPDVVAPPTLLTDTFRFYGDTLTENGLPYALERHSLGTPIRAGNSYRFFRQLHPTDVVTATRKIARVWQKQGRSGSLTFREVEITYRNQDEELLVVNTEVLCYRDSEDGGGEA